MAVSEQGKILHLSFIEKETYHVEKELEKKVFFHHLKFVDSGKFQLRFQHKDRKKSREEFEWKQRST